MDKKTFYVTTPIYYPSGRFHIGTAYTTVLADALKRYKVLRGYDARMLTGLDEHGQKIERVALAQNKTPQEYVDDIAIYAKDLWKKMEIDYDDFIRTTQPRHEKVASAIFDKLMKQGDIYKGEYEGWYCTPCETYFTELQLLDGKCPDCGRPVEKMKEEAYFFNMKKYESRLLKYYDEHPDFIVPEARKNEIVNNFIKPGLEDLCITRTSFKWGIPVLSDPKHVIYVWLDALTNYISALGYLSDDDTLFKKYWPADVHIVGKDIIRFHGIYWPIFLMALGLPLPKKIYAHAWFTMKDGKMSKSKGNVIYPELLIDRYGLEATKYYLLRGLGCNQDYVVTPEDFVEKFNIDLCNDLGNLLNRTISMVNKYVDGNILKYTGKVNTEDDDVEKVAMEQIKIIEKEMDNINFPQALAEIWKIISRSNKYIDETAPWVLAKSEEKEKLNSVLYHLVENLRRVAILIRPVMPKTSDNMLNQLGIKEESLKSWNSLYDYTALNNIKVIEKGEPLFMRLNVEEEIEYIKEGMKRK